MPAKIVPNRPKTGGKRAKVVAAALISGKTKAQVAREAGVSRQAVNKSTPAAQQFISELVDGYRPRLEDLFVQVLDVIQQGLAADRMALAREVSTTKQKDGRTERSETSVPVSLGPDHFARLTAAKRFCELLLAGRATPKAPDEATSSRSLTWPEVQALVQKLQLNPSPKP